MEARCTERDWKLFRSRLPQWQQAYMEKLNKEYVALLTADADADEKFWALEKRLREDRKKVGVCAEMSRSRVIWNLISLVNEGAISRADLDGFSEEVLEVLDYICFRQDPQGEANNTGS